MWLSGHGWRCSWHIYSIYPWSFAKQFSFTPATLNNMIVSIFWKGVIACGCNNTFQSCINGLGMENVGSNQTNLHQLQCEPCIYIYIYIFSKIYPSLSSIRSSWWKQMNIRKCIVYFFLIYIENLWGGMMILICDVKAILFQIHFRITRSC